MTKEELTLQQTFPCKITQDSLHVMRWYFLHYDTAFLIFCCEQNTEDNASEMSVLWTSSRWFVEFEIYSIIGKFHILLWILPMQHCCSGLYKYTLWYNVPFSFGVSRIRKITHLSERDMVFEKMIRLIQVKEFHWWNLTNSNFCNSTSTNNLLDVHIMLNTDVLSSEFCAHRKRRNVESKCIFI